ncbi:hypothetical protein B0G57_117106 [Trinickia symbiotica]|uniref:DUF1868 domain-containing protein n=2 Tax=Burkholderiaceae TaxID=119060 RepID=A0A2N7X628_9BURK|nr:DUF1868 domain-containing protein [Trinickia symbiotica]PPK42715.1 hypothetical protein B0G57_117106 [Trinickia symbiotica]
MKTAGMNTIDVSKVPPISLDHIGKKFDSNGNVLRYPGNTLVCHVPLFTPLSDALVAVRDTIRSSLFASSLTFLPPESYHMTVFEGVADRERDNGRWPMDLPHDASVLECTRHFAAKLESFDLGCALPLRLRVAERANQTHIGCIKLVPVDAAEERKLRDLRTRLAECLSLRTAWHDHYEFHITLSYLIRPMTPDVTRACLDLVSGCFAGVGMLFDVIELGAPEFCVFNDMYAFDNQFFLRRIASQ